VPVAGVLLQAEEAVRLLRAEQEVRLQAEMIWARLKDKEVQKEAFRKARKKACDAKRYARNNYARKKACDAKRCARKKACAKSMMMYSTPGTIVSFFPIR